MKAKRCYNCKFWATQDEGYSNYTVTLTMVHCLKKKFDCFEESYSWEYDKDNDFFKKAETCSEFKHKEGLQISLDVDEHVTIEDFKEDKELYEAAKSYGW